MQEATNFFGKNITLQNEGTVHLLFMSKLKFPNPLSWEGPFKIIKPGLSKRLRIYRGIFAMPVEPAADEDGPLDGHGRDEHVQGHSWQPVP
jgi:hypothetical protein